ncbi:MAG: Fic family protein, partial [Betaproteobacteria bacterium]|nr:Fic family protein [Betaproteobacteria bacterium]
MRLASFEAIIGALHGAEVRYLIAGGLAVGAHGYLRTTPGVDLVVRLATENVERLFAALQGLGYWPGMPVTAEQFADAAARENWIGQNGAALLGFRSDRHRETPVKVFAAEPFCFEDEYAKALVKPLHGAIPVRFVCIDTLIGMKEASGRLADRADGEELRLTLKVDEPLDLQPGEIDWRLTTWEGSRREQLRCWAADEADNESYELEGGDRALACAAAGGASAPPPRPHSPERGREHGLRGGAGGPSDAAGATRPPNGAMRTVETRFGVVAYGELAPHLARNVLELEERIEDGEFATAALDERLVLEEHAPPEFFKVPALVREYGLDLQMRLSALTGHADDLMLEALAFAEGRLLSIHPFADFNGLVTRVWLREILRRLNLPPVCLAPVEPAARQVYLSALGSGDRNDRGPLMDVW